MSDTAGRAEGALAPGAVRALVDNHRNFLAFLERRGLSRADAEDTLQAAYVRTLASERRPEVGEGAVAWLYRLLRNALVDHYRHAGATQRALSAEADRLGDGAVDPDLESVVCACLDALIPTLKPEYGAVIRAVDLGERPIADLAASLGLTPNNLRVRLHRARQALKRQLERSCGTCATHGCLDCACGAPAVHEH